MVTSESRTSAFATSIAALSMSPTAPRFDAVAANAPVGLQGCERKTELLFHRARQEPAHAVLLPVRRLHHLFDAGPLGLAQQCEHALLLGDALDHWFVSLQRRLGVGRAGRESANCAPAALRQAPASACSSRSRRRCYSSRYFFLGGVAIFMSEGSDSATFCFSLFGFLASRLLRT